MDCTYPHMNDAYTFDMHTTRRDAHKALQHIHIHVYTSVLEEMGHAPTQFREAQRGMLVKANCF